MKKNYGISIANGSINPEQLVVGKKSKIINNKVDKKLKDKEKNSAIIFLSYRRNDGIDITGRIYDRLSMEFGEARIFKDMNSIPLGADFKKNIESNINKSSVVLAIIGKNWLGHLDNSFKNRIDNPDDFIRFEMSISLENNKKIIPLFIDGGKISDEKSLPIPLRPLFYLNGINIRPDPDFDNDMNKLFTSINS